MINKQIWTDWDTHIHTYILEKYKEAVFDREC